MRRDRAGSLTDFLRPADSAASRAARRGGARDGNPDRRAAAASIGSSVAAYGHQVYLNVVLDPRVGGGMAVQVGEERLECGT
jgi:hypothetical protein